MVELIFTLCITASSCEDHVVDSFDTLQECQYERAAFIVGNDISPDDAAKFTCGAPSWKE